MAEQTAPRTAAGRLLMDEDVCWDKEVLTDYITRIEVEAAASPAAPAVDVEQLVDIIEQAIFETDTGLEAALLASERIAAALQASPPTAQPSPLDVGLPPLTDEQLAEGDRRLHEAGPFADPSPASSEGRDSE